MKPVSARVLAPSVLASVFALACLEPGGSATEAPAPDPAPAAPSLELATVAAQAPIVREHDVMESAFCAECHPAIYAEHEQSTHGRAYTDAEVRMATARFDLKDCIICHTPRPIFETGIGQNPTRRYHGLEEGNTCMTCHWRPDYDYGAFTGGAECTEAFHPDVGTVDACASCHRNHGTPYQWERSPLGKVTGRECLDCHMAEIERPVAVGGPVRGVRSHLFPGARSESQVGRAYSYKVELDDNAAVVSVKNRGAGHNFPTELKQRSVESLVVVRNLDGEEIARSRMVFRDPYKRPYGLELPVNTQIPSGETRQHRVPLTIADGTVETTLFYKLYYPIEDYHPDLSRVLESRVLPFADVTPSDEEVISAPDVRVVTPEGITPEASSVANLVDYARPPIGTVEVDIPAGEAPEDIQRLIELFQFPVPQANGEARDRLVEIGLPAVPALIEALGSWDNKTYNQARSVLERIGRPARAEIAAALDSDQLYVRLHSRDLVTRLVWRGEDIEQPLARGLTAPVALDRSSAARAIGRLGMGDQSAALRPLLTDTDPDVVREAGLALAELGAKEAIAEIESAMEQAHYPETQRDLALALSRLGSPAGVPKLLTGLDYPDDLIRESFFEAFFAATGVHEGYDPLAPRPQRLASIAALQAWWATDGGERALLAPDPDRDPIAEAYARTLVSKLGGSDLGPSGSERDLSIEEELVGMGKYAVPALIRGLKYPPGFGSKRALICRSLGRIGDRRSAPALASTLRDPVVAVAAWAAWALEGQADPATLPALARYEQRLRTLIASGTVPVEAGPGDRLLAQVARTRLAAGDDDAVDTLATLLLSKDEYSRQLAFEALRSKFGEDRGYDPSADDAARREAAVRWMR
ncbi:MAG: HEAT repeat domain-containing protein [Planctomycetota bacterium]